MGDPLFVVGMQLSILCMVALAVIYSTFLIVSITFWAALRFAAQNMMVLQRHLKSQFRFASPSMSRDVKTKLLRGV